MKRPLLLDLFCGAGGAAMGYHRAGFDVIGVDVNRQQLRQYPFPCVRADALTPPFDLTMFDAIHASPPCQAYSSGTPDRSVHPKLVEPVRDMLADSGRPYVIENVVGAPLRAAIMLCGTMFGLSTSTGLTLNRHRYFELGGWTFDALVTPCQHKRGRTITVTGNGPTSGNRATIGRNVSVDEFREVMGMPWTNRRGTTEAIPPAYTEFLGAHLLEAIHARAAA